MLKASGDEQTILILTMEVFGRGAVDDDFDQKSFILRAVMDDFDVRIICQRAANDDLDPICFW